MDVEQRQWKKETGWKTLGSKVDGEPDVVFVFGSTAHMESSDRLKEVRAIYPNATLVGGSTGGEIQGEQVLEDSVVTAGITFEATGVETTRAKLDNSSSSYVRGEEVAQSLCAPDLSHVFLLSDGVRVNGNALVDGAARHLPENVTVTGGLAADGDRFERTPLWLDRVLETPSVVGVGFYGNRLMVGHGSLGGWDPFGPRRRIEKSDGDVLYEFDNHTALELYERYLGPYAEDLPASGLRFPLAIQGPDQSHEIVRTVVGMDEDDQSVTFAGSVPEGSYARLMKANNERLIDGAIGAAESSRGDLGDTPADLALLVSCIGRKQVLKQRIEEEVEQATRKLGRGTSTVGFYAYGEIAPAPETQMCEMHNQTMTITTFAER
ncbi:FIST signal transduction protein [Salinibacter grassmerensis]|uniref:FIST signal transduction protein n=1 Tax=Salinibacter grassmerensis TaxID=3040353 RepID=UPI0021E6F5A7|nr:FIST N-terminal domain-containing protein [Salinibacter grassmerensis]